MNENQNQIQEQKYEDDDNYDNDQFDESKPKNDVNGIPKVLQDANRIKINEVADQKQAEESYQQKIKDEDNEEIVDNYE